MSSNAPFRGELEAAHQRIEQLTAKYETRIAELEEENARLRKRLIDGAPKSWRSRHAMFGVAAFVCSAALLGLFLVVFVRESAHPRPIVEMPPQPLPTPTTVPTIPVVLEQRDARSDLPSCRCASGDPLCAEIPGLTCK